MGQESRCRVSCSGFHQAEIRVPAISSEVSSGPQLVGSISFHVVISLRPLLPVSCWPGITLSSRLLPVPPRHGALLDASQHSSSASSMPAGLYLLLLRLLSRAYLISSGLSCVTSLVIGSESIDQSKITGGLLHHIHSFHPDSMSEKDTAYVPKWAGFSGPI